MSEDNLEDTLDFDESIYKTVLHRKMFTARSDESKVTDNKTNVLFPETLITLENDISDNPYKTQDDRTDKREDKFVTYDDQNLEHIKSDSKVFVLVFPENPINREDNTENNINDKKYSDNDKIACNIDLISGSSDSSTNKVNAEFLNATSPKPQGGNCNDTVNDNYDSDCSGYHSSDFEFITESEAMIDGLIKHSKNLQRTIKNTISPDFSSSPSCISTHNPNSDEDKDLFNENNDLPSEFNQNITNTMLQPGPSSSMDNNNVKMDLAAGPSASHNNLRYYQTCRRAPCDSKPGYNIFQNDLPVHNAVPEGEAYFDLFRGMYDPALPLCDILVMENKSFRPTGMNVEFEGIGFDMRLMRNMDGSSQDEFESEAEESVKEILRMYPGDNRKRRRRY